MDKNKKIKELQRQNRESTELINNPFKKIKRIVEVENGKGHAKVSLEGFAVKLIASSFRETLKDAPNYITGDVFDSEVNAFYEFTIRRKGKKSPTERIQELEADLSNQNTNMKNVLSAKRRMAEHIMALKAEVDRLTESLNEIQESGDELADEVCRLEDELKTGNMLTAQLTDKCRDLEAENQALTLKLQASKRNCTILDGIANVLRVEIKRLKEQLEKYKHQDTFDDTMSRLVFGYNCPKCNNSNLREGINKESNMFCPQCGFFPIYKTDKEN